MLNPPLLGRIKKNLPFGTETLFRQKASLPVLRRQLHAQFRHRACKLSVDGHYGEESTCGWIAVQRREMWRGQMPLKNVLCARKIYANSRLQSCRLESGPLLQQYANKKRNCDGVVSIDAAPELTRTSTRIKALLL